MNHDVESACFALIRIPVQILLSSRGVGDRQDERGQSRIRREGCQLVFLQNTAGQVRVRIDAETRVGIEQLRKNDVRLQLGGIDEQVKACRHRDTQAQRGGDLLKGCHSAVLGQLKFAGHAVFIDLHHPDRGHVQKSQPGAEADMQIRVAGHHGGVGLHHHVKRTVQVESRELQLSFNMHQDVRNTDLRRLAAWRIRNRQDEVTLVLRQGCQRVVEWIPA